MAMKDSKGMRPLLLKFGVALALSFAGFLYSHLRTKRMRSIPSSPRFPPPPSPPPSGDANKFDDTDGREDLKDDLHSIQAPLDSSEDSSFTAHIFEASSHHKFTNDGNDVGVGVGVGVGLSLISEDSVEEEELLVFKDSMASKIVTEVEETEKEIINLRNMVKVLQEKEKDFETQLLKYYGLKEQETAVMELQNRLKINNVEAKLYTLRIESLQAENRRLESQVADSARVVAELETARAKIKMLKRKQKSDEEQSKELLSAIQERVANLQEQEQMAMLNEADVQKKLKRLKELEDESAELKKTNSSLQKENSELAMRLESTQILASSILEDPETEVLREANNRLRQENEEFSKEIERFRSDCCADVEELVYLRWVNACLRYELRNYRPSPGKTVARDLSKTLSPKSEEKAKQLILEYANSEGIGDKDPSIVDFDSDQWSSSQVSYLTDSGEYEDTYHDASSAIRTHTPSKTKFFRRLKGLVLGKDGHNRTPSPSVDRSNTTSFAGSGMMGSASTTSFEDMLGTYSCDTLSSHHNSSAMATPLTGIGARTGGQSTQSSFSRGFSSRSSLDIQRLRNLQLDDIRDGESIRSNSDVGSSFGYKSTVLGENDNQLDQDDPDAREKLELINFAEVLRGSRGTTKLKKSKA